MSENTVDLKRFNLDRSYGDTPLFLGEEPGLFDTINKQYPKIWGLYKTLKSQDWDANEFNYSTCNVEFKTTDPSTYDMMIKQLAWQWEADSVASRSILGVMSPYISSDELFATWARVVDNENVHAETYSEIVRLSFDDPQIVLNEVLSIHQAFERTSVVDRIMEQARVRGLKYALGMVPNDQETYNAAFLFVCALYMLERIQFMSSFAITFTICNTGAFNPIGKAVQKIAADEFEVHSELDKIILQHEMKTERGQRAFQMCHETIQQMADEIMTLEFDWIDYLHRDGREGVGRDPDVFKEWSLFVGEEVFNILDLSKSRYTFPERNPLHLMKDWLNLDGNQSAPQEENHGQYRVGKIRRDDEGMIFDFAV